MVGVSGFEVTRRPSPRSTAVPVVTGSFAVAASAAGGGPAAAVAAAGVATVAVGVWTARHGVVDAGGLVTLLGVVVAALAGAGAVPVVFGTLATVVTWDAGGNAVSLGRQLGREVDTVRVESLHVLAGAGVGVLGSAVGFVLFSVGPTRQPVTTLFVLLVAAAALVVALNR